jgi:ParB family chromosome partitioning protein
MTDLPINTITILRKQRQRKSIGNVDDLANSIQRFGLITPIALLRDNTLVSGERRLTALKQLGWATLSHGRHFIYLDELSEVDRLAIEFEENAKRKDLSWPEQCEAVYKLHNLQRERDPDWTQTSTAEFLNFSQGHIQRLLAVAEESRKDPTLYEADKLSVAANTVTRRRERAAASMLDTLDEPPTTTEPGSPAPPTAPAPAAPILTGDFMDWAETYTGPSFNFIHFDPPYGINYDKNDNQNTTNKDNYEDSIETYKRIVTEGLPDLPIAESAHMIFWFSMRHYAWTLVQLRDQGWKVHDSPLIWYRSDNSGLLPDPAREGRRVYETAFHCTKGDRKLVKPKSNVSAAPRGPTQEHASLKPVSMLTHFFEMFIDEHTRMLDPTCGSGSSLRAAHDLGASKVLGIELNPDYAADARRLWANHLNRADPEQIEIDL